MKLWLILYTSTGIGGTWGPLPYDMAACESVAAARMAEVSAVITSRKSAVGKEVPASVIDKLKTWRLECELRADRPKLASETQ